MHLGASAMLIAAIVIAFAVSSASAQGFPVTITHALGDTTIQTQPRRVVSLGYNDQDFLYALGIAPVAVTQWWSNQPYATWPWAERARLAVGAAPAVAKGSGVNFEWVLAQDPDLIVATYRDLDRATYDRLARIAPVIARPVGYPVWSAPWEEQLRLLDRATSGNTDKAETIISRLGAKIASVRKRYPQFKGKFASMADLRDAQFTLWGSETAPARFLGALGFRLPQELDALADPAGWIYLSLEQARLMDIDVVVWPNGKRTEIEAISTYRRLRLFREGHSVWPAGDDLTWSAALWFQTPLSIDFAIDYLAPALAAALDGDPGTGE